MNKIIDETNQNIELTNQEHTGKIELIECKLQQFEEQMKDIQKHSIEFEREFSKYSKKEKVNFYYFSKNIKNFKLDQFLFSEFKGVADKYVRFTQDKLASQDAQISKLKLKRQAMRDQLHKGKKN